ncbi:uncharacterized protein HaLaN_15109 [Haematococcus lacustris]|uniref:Uncharacterized protein n=1 Tax=Haematococcus lacustris TaxID=44745 RepID=A0A699ZGX4_HAELA|nr:uncharacterized protein HaLaN_15109 [Haematococcus lacustris]
MQRIGERGVAHAGAMLMDRPVGAARQGQGVPRLGYNAGCCPRSDRSAMSVPGEQQPIGNQRLAPVQTTRAVVAAMRRSPALPIPRVLQSPVIGLAGASAMQPQRKKRKAENTITAATDGGPVPKWLASIASSKKQHLLECPAFPKSSAAVAAAKLDSNVSTVARLQQQHPHENHATACLQGAHQPRQGDGTTVVGAVPAPKVELKQMSQTRFASLYDMLQSVQDNKQEEQWRNSAAEEEQWRSSGGAVLRRSSGAEEEQWRRGGAVEEQWRSRGGAVEEQWRSSAAEEEQWKECMASQPVGAA